MSRRGSITRSSAANRLYPLVVSEPDYGTGVQRLSRHERAGPEARPRAISAEVGIFRSGFMRLLASVKRGQSDGATGCPPAAKVLTINFLIYMKHQSSYFWRLALKWWSSVTTRTKSWACGIAWLPLGDRRYQPGTPDPRLTERQCNGLDPECLRNKLSRISK